MNVLIKHFPVLVLLRLRRCSTSWFVCYITVAYFEEKLFVCILPHTCNPATVDAAQLSAGTSPRWRTLILVISLRNSNRISVIFMDFEDKIFH